jgi:uncharacterized protein DUF5765
MCWSGEASGVLAAIGLGTATYIAHKGESKELWIPLTYFALMELLQAVTYIYIDLCGLPQNQILTLLGYVHIAFQPFFVNMVGMYFIPQAVKERISTHVYALCSLAALAMLIKMYPFEWAGLCRVGEEVFCGPTTCSVSGDWHIAWQMPLNGIFSEPIDYWLDVSYGLHGRAYILAGFLLPLLYGSWRFVVFHWFVGPTLSELLTTNPNEFAAVWCLFSIALCVSVIKTPLRRHLHVERWPLFKWLGYSREEEEGEPAYSDEQA